MRLPLEQGETQCWYLVPGDLYQSKLNKGWSIAIHCSLVFMSVHWDRRNYVTKMILLAVPAAISSQTKVRSKSAVQSILCVAPHCPRGSPVPYKSEKNQFHCRAGCPNALNESAVVILRVICIKQTTLEQYFCLVLLKMICLQHTPLEIFLSRSIAVLLSRICL